MRGERLTWYRLAARFGIPIQRFKDETSSTDFAGWQQFLIWEAGQKFKRREKWEWYAALIAFEIFNCFRSKRSGKLEDFLLNFGGEKDHQSSTQKSKQAWMTAFIGGKEAIKTRTPPPQN